MNGRVRKIFGPARLDVPAGAAGSTREYRLVPSPGGKDVEFATYVVRFTAVSNVGQAGFKFRLYHGPDGTESTTHTTDVIATTTPSSVPAVAVGDSDHSKMLGEWLHPSLFIGTADGNAQWAIAEVWEVRQALPYGQGVVSHRRVAAPTRYVASAAGNSPGIGLEDTDRGAEARTAQYALVVHDANATTAQISVSIEHSIDREQWVTQKSYALAALGSTGRQVLLYDSDPDKGLLPYVRGVVKVPSSGSDSILAELYETLKPY